MKRFYACLCGALLMALAAFPALAQQATVQQVEPTLSPPLSESIALMRAQAAPSPQAPYAVPNKMDKLYTFANRTSGLSEDPVLQRTNGTERSAGVLVGWPGTDDDDNAAVLGFRVVPPDTEGDVGPNHYVQWNNLVAEIFDRTGTSLSGGPFAGNAFFAGMGGICQNTNSGDPIVLYDHLADRWLVSQFALDFGANNYSMCVGISETPDPLGAYYQYEFNFGNIGPDYPKLGVMESGYYMTTRDFQNFAFYVGSRAHALERSEMLLGNAAQIVTFTIPGGTSIDGYLPSDLDGPSPGASFPGLFAGAPGNDEPNELEIFAFDPDFANGGAGATFTELMDIAVSPFTFCGTGFSGTCVQQPAGGENLPTLPAFLMHRLALRDMGTHLSLLANHTVDVGASRAGIRWYEARCTSNCGTAGNDWGLHQEGTYAPADSEERFMGSMGMNSNGDIALGYSVSSSQTFPSIRYTGQSAAMSGTGIMDIAETSILVGTGAQQSSSQRWGDYSMLTPDPIDDTFWYTQEYYETTGSFDFDTWIAQFSLDTGGGDDCAGVDLEMNDGFAFHWCWDIVDNGTVDCPAGSFDERDLDGVIENAYTAGGTSTGYVCKLSASSASTFLEAVNNAADGCVSGETDSFEYTGTRSGPFMYSGTWESFCSGVVDGTGTWDGTFVKNFAPQIQRSTGASPAMRASKAARTETAQGFSLEQNYPNPFNPTTLIRFTLPEASDVRLTVYNALGQQVGTLVQGFTEAGAQTVAFDGSRLAAGTYLYTIEAGAFRASRQMTLLK